MPEITNSKRARLAHLYDQIILTLYNGLPARAI